MDEKVNRLGPLLSDVGNEIVAMIDGDLGDVYYFVAAGDGWVRGGVYVDSGDTVRWLVPSDRLYHLTWDIWEAERDGGPDANAWVYMEYVVTGQKFNVSFTYADDVAPGTTVSDWEEIAVKARFGDKCIVYPPL